MTIVITEEDRRMVKYFLEEKGDVTRWCDWEEKKEALFTLYPELHTALFNLDVAERTLKHVVEGIANDY